MNPDTCPHERIRITTTTTTWKDCLMHNHTIRRRLAGIRRNHNVTVTCLDCGEVIHQQIEGRRLP